MDYFIGIRWGYNKIIIQEGKNKDILIEFESDNLQFNDEKELKEFQKLFNNMLEQFITRKNNETKSKD